MRRIRRFATAIDDALDDALALAGDECGVAPYRARFDWRTRAPSRRRAGGLLADAGGEHERPRRTPYPVRPLALGERWHYELENYKARFLPLLAAEQETEATLVRTRLAQWSQDRLAREGYCLAGLSAFWLHEPQFGRPAAAFLLGPGVALPFHRFENGAQVLLSHADPLRALTAQGCVVGSSETDLRIGFEARINLDGQTWRLDLFTTDISFERMRAAIQCLNYDPAAQERNSTTAGTEGILAGTHLRDVLLPAFAARPAPAAPAPASTPGIFSRDQRIHSWARRHRAPHEPVVAEGDPDLGALNASQRRAVALMLGERVSLVQGPPGTGKTRTIVEAVRLLKTHFLVPHPLLVCTYTNPAVDTLVAGLAAAGLTPLRVGASPKIPGALRRWTLDARLERHPAWPALQTLRQTIAYVERHLHPGDRFGSTVPTLKAMRAQAWAMHREMVRDVVDQSDVLCTTCITAATAALGVVDFPVVFLDEASMSTEPASLIPLMKGARHLALIGDHKQLPPVVTSRKAQAGGLGVSLFERLIGENAVPSIMLDVQYRMHPALARFPSAEFYDHALRNGTVDAAGTVPARLHPPASSLLAPDPRTGRRPSVLFLDHAGGEEMRDRSRMNRHEARIVCAVIEDLLLQNPTMLGRDIGVIAPYAAQIALLGRLLQTDGAYRAQAAARLGPLRAMQVGAVEVKTVDGFEGREKDVIVFSTVRNNAHGHIGFLGDRRRMNVGLTRARRALFVVGSAGTLGRARGGAEGDVWVRYMEWLAGRGAVRAWGDRWVTREKVGPGAG